MIFFQRHTKDFLVRKTFLFLYIVLVLEMICYYLMSAQQAWKHLIANVLEVKYLLFTDMDLLSHTLYQLSSQPYCCDLISLFMSFLIIFPSLWKGKCDRDFFPFWFHRRKNVAYIWYVEMQDWISIPVPSSCWQIVQPKSLLTSLGSFVGWWQSSAWGQEEGASVFVTYIMHYIYA